MKKLQIKIFEELLPLESLFNTIKNSLKSQYSISAKSQIFIDSFLIIVINTKKYSFFIRGAIHNLKNRTILTIVAFDIKSFMKLLNFNDELKNFENYLYELITNDANENFLDPFRKISLSSQNISKFRRKIKSAERNILNIILPALYKEFNYQDDLVNYPFSIFRIERTFSFWVEVYGSYLDKIENAILKNDKNSIKVYKYYDFAHSKEVLPRIMDLIIIEDVWKKGGSINAGETNELGVKNSKLEIKTNVNEPLKELTKWMTFISSHKKLSPMKIIEVLKLSEEIEKFTKILSGKICNNSTTIKPLIIFLSQYGYEERIGKYLRDNLYHDFRNVFPMFIVPPINNGIWHNFSFSDNLSQEDIYAKKRAKRYINLHKKNSQTYSYLAQKFQNAKENYSEIVEKERKSRKNLEFVNKWSKILNINKSNELLKVIDNKKKIERGINILNE